MTLDYKTAELAPGDGVVIPEGAVQGMEAFPGQEDVAYIVIGIYRGSGGKAITV
jgi:mannose-6-phosphate isomerase-like protein (cupin superfamily)